MIDTTDDAGRLTGTARFRLWPAQAPVVWTLMTAPMVLILKARQLGISWVVCGYVLWLCLFRTNQTALLLSKGKGEAKELVDRVQKLYDRLPGELRALLPDQVKDNTGELKWANGSRIMSLAATRGAGRTYTAQIAVLDELDHMTWGREVYTSVYPVVEAGGQLVCLSTANGAGNLMHTLWDQARAGRNAFRRVFLPWWARPGRDAAWYGRTVANAHDPRVVRQEYPANDVEAFLATGHVRFEPEWVAAQLPHARRAPRPPRSWGPAMKVRRGWDGLDPGLLPALESVPGLAVWEEPRQNRRYLIAADVAEGLEGGDADSAVVLDADTLEEVADLHGRWEPKDFARYLMALSEPYDAWVWPERNNHGHAVLASMALAFFPRVGVGHDGRPGWHTTPKTKPAGVDLLAEHLKEGTVTVRSAATLGEMQVYKRLAGGRLGGAQGFHDDRVMKWVVAVSVARQGLIDRHRRTARAGRNPLAGYRG